MKKFLTLAISLVILPCLAMHSQSSKQIAIPGHPESDVQQSVTDNISGTRKICHNILKEADNTVKATLKFPMLDKEWKMPWGQVTVYNEEGYFEEIDISPYDDEGNFAPTDRWEIYLPAGKYDFLSMFRKINMDNVFQEDHVVYYIVENINIAEGSVIELKPWESTIHIAMETTNPNGDKTRFRKIRYLDEDWNWEVIEEGNITDASLEKEVYYKGKRVATLLTNAGGVIVEPGPCGEFNPQDECDFFVNKVSNNYVFRCLRYMPSWPNEENGLYLAVTEARGSSGGIYTNSRNYNLEDGIIKNTLACSKYPPIDTDGESVNPYSLSFFSYSKGSASDVGKVFFSPEETIWKVWYAGPEHPIDKDDIYLVYSKTYEDAYIILHSEWGDYVVPKSVEGPNIYPFASGGNSINASISGNVGWNPGDVFYPLNPFPGNETFVSLLSETDLSAGESAPLLISWITPYFNWAENRNASKPTFYYSGRLSEKLGSTTDLATATLSFNGKEVARTLADAQQYMTDNGGQKGRYQLDVTTDNFEIDGLKGGNRAVAIWNSSEDGFTSPSATMLQFRNAQNKLTQHLATPEDGKMILSAADFEICEGEAYEWGEKKTWFDPKVPAKVSAWCTPYGSTADAVNEIALVEDPEGYYAPGFGALYTASLSSIDIPSKTGWYDLTIVVEGANGNRQTQTVSPAFRIDSMAGIDSVFAEHGVKVSGNTISAPAGSRVFTVSGAETGLSDLPQGVYIVCTPTAVCKVVVN